MIGQDLELIRQAGVSTMLRMVEAEWGIPWR